MWAGVQPTLDSSAETFWIGPMRQSPMAQFFRNSTYFLNLSPIDARPALLGRLSLLKNECVCVSICLFFMHGRFWEDLHKIWNVASL